MLSAQRKVVFDEDQTCGALGDGSQWRVETQRRVEGREAKNAIRPALGVDVTINRGGPASFDPNIEWIGLYR